MTNYLTADTYITYIIATASYAVSRCHRDVIGHFLDTPVIISRALSMLIFPRQLASHFAKMAGSFGALLRTHSRHMARLLFALIGVQGAEAIF